MQAEAEEDMRVDEGSDMRQNTSFAGTAAAAVAGGIVHVAAHAEDAAAMKPCLLKAARLACNSKTEEVAAVVEVHTASHANQQPVEAYPDFPSLLSGHA